MRRIKHSLMRGAHLALGRNMATTVALLVAMIQTSSAVESIDGFIVPYRIVDVATAETGIVRKIVVRVGDVVEPAQVLAQLNDDVYLSLLAIAEKSMRSEGRLIAARAESRLRELRLKKLKELVGRGSARQEEVERAEADEEIALAQLLAIEEDLAIKQLEYQRARIQWERRTVRAPMRGVVLRLHKEVGEFIGPNDPQLMTIVQLDPLLAVFAVPSHQARHLRIGHKVHVRLPEAEASASGAVESISPVVDGKSGTMRVEVRLNNPKRRLYSGEPCSLLLDDKDKQDSSDITSVTSPSSSHNTPPPSSDQNIAGPR